MKAAILSVAWANLGRGDTSHGSFPWAAATSTTVPSSTINHAKPCLELPDALKMAATNWHEPGEAMAEFIRQARWTPSS